MYLSPAETERMQRLARERLPRFLALQGRFANSKDWVILSPRGKYTPETVLQLQRGLANDVPARSFLH